MRILISGHGKDRAALDAARRAIGYDKLVLITHRPAADDLQEILANEKLAEAIVEIHEVPADDFLAALASATAVLTASPDDSVTVHVAGSTNMVTSALLVAAFERGVTAIFCHERGISRLPVIHQATFVDLLSKADITVILNLSHARRVEHDALARGGITLNMVRASLQRLRKMGFADPDGKTACLTPTGLYYQRHLLSKGGTTVRGNFEPSDAPKKGARHSSKQHGRTARSSPTPHSRQSGRLRSR